MLVVFPAWLLAGLGDYLCHRASRISETSGTRESVLHLLQFSLVGIPVVLTLFLQVNAGLFLVLIFFLVLHHAVAFIDVRYANSTRKVVPIEQMLHSVLEIVPICAFLLVSIIYWPQMMALFGLGDEAARFWPEAGALPGPYIMAALIAAFVLNGVPYLEELVRCLRRHPAVQARLP
jgi:hypothetical protein